jgi:hypothetical protein
VATSVVSSSAASESDERVLDIENALEPVVTA